MKRLVIISILQFATSIKGQEIEPFLDSLISSHPEIRALDAELKSKHANAGHETTYPDPKIGISFRNYPTRSYSLNNRAYDTPSMTGIEYSISQEIPFPGRLTLQGKVRKLEEIEFLHFSKSRKNQFLLEYLSQLIRFRSANLKINLNSQIQKTLESQKVISASNFATGSSALDKTLKLQIEGTISLDRQIELTRDKDNAKAFLSYYVSDSVSLTKILETDLTKYLSEKHLFIKTNKANLRLNLTENPNYKLSSVAVERAKNESKLSSLLHAPDTELFFAYMRRRNQIIAVDDGPLNYQVMDQTEYRGDLFSVGINVRVPVWSFFSAHDLAERSNENTKSKSFELEKNKLFLESNFDKLLLTFESLESQIELYENKLIPELNKSLSASSAGYASGSSNLIEALASKIDLLKAYVMLEEVKEKKDLTVILILELTDSLLKAKNN
ncbi:outer membrane efflux protein [Leptospira meyeri]|uniref:Outer membrane efflux protein n=2 Tax=Leptospira TaxID=171 RepID=A0A4V3HHQ7_LEPME|nr:TolC family protein [Leptospira meyeri]TDY66764.1 outer membrane efflux protein [Leptospira meyeri]GBF44428.1 outer membrane efflux protein [Leptospira ellinghausenii]